MIKKKAISIARFITQVAYLVLFITGVMSGNFISLFINISALLLGPIFCGWMCFVGLYQDSLRGLGQFIKKEPIEIDKKFHNFLKYLRYVLLFGALTAGGLFLFSGKVWGSFSQLIKGHIVLDIAFYCLIILGALSLFTKRFFCRYFCTFGARLGLFSLLRPIIINKDSSCISCKNCSKECLMQIEVDKANSLVHPSCINCFKCIESCPQKSLKIGVRNYLKP